MAENNWIAGRYEFLAEIGRGGMGLVARAYDHRLDTEVAIKVLRPDLAKDSGDKDSLIKEARVLARLTHPSIVRLFDLAETEIGLMLILEFVRGPNLAQVLEKRGRLTQPEWLHVARQICSGLAAAHAEGVIHRDLKPPNLLVAPGLPEAAGPAYLLNSKIKITDFGISKLLASKAQGPAGASPADAATTAAGTPIFMAPEQFAGRPCTAATDVYALGVIAYVALSGRPPFVSDNVRDLALQHFRATADPIEGCSPAINAVVQRALAKAPGERFQSAMDFLSAFESACAPPPPPLAAQPPILEPDGLDRAAAWLGSHRWRLIGGLVVVVAATIGLLVLRAPRRAAAETGIRTKPSPPALGKLIDLPADLDVASAVTTLPPPIAMTPLPVQPGPRKTPHAVWTALLESDDFHASAAVDGIAPDGTVYIRDEGSKSLWAVNGLGLKWGFRAAEPANLARFGVHMPSWPDGSHVDFRDPGRVWLASCPDPRAACDGVVFNSEGKGGMTAHVPSALHVRPAVQRPVSSDFREDDPQHRHWPDEAPRLRCESRLGSVTLSSIDQRWAVRLDGRCSKAVEAGGRLIVATVRNTVFSIDEDGRVDWTFAAPDMIQAIEIVPASGRVMLLSGQEHDRLLAIDAGVKQWEFQAPGWMRDFGAADSAGSMYLLSTRGNDLGFHDLDATGQQVWTLLWTGLTSSSERLSIDKAGRLYLSDGRFEVGGKVRKAVVCLSE